MSWIDDLEALGERLKGAGRCLARDANEYPCRLSGPPVSAWCDSCIANAARKHWPKIIAALRAAETEHGSVGLVAVGFDGDGTTLYAPLCKCKLPLIYCHEGSALAALSDAVTEGKS